MFLLEWHKYTAASTLKPSHLRTANRQATEIMRAFLVLLLVAAANAASLLKASEPIFGQYIVKIKSDFDVQSVLPTVRLAGGRVGHVYNAVFNGFAAKLSEKVLDAVLNLPAVEYVEEDGVVRTQAVGSWGLDRIDQANLPLDDSYDSTKRGTNGAGYNVYVIDTGINPTHNDFGGRAVTAWSAMARSEDCNGHGTHCSGTVAGTEYGVAKGVNVYGVKVLNCFGSGSWSDVIAGVDWVSASGARPAVASMSLGGGYTDSLNEAVKNLVNSGVQTAVAAGNDNSNACNYSPASEPEAVTVGSTTSTDARSSFSNYGNCVDVFAPGSSITSAWYTSNTATNTISGTSMACPHVAGALAIYGILNGNDGERAAAALVNEATSGVVGNPGWNSPNKLLYV
ncbi:uncharacterized protein LOC115918348 [Strongylocentrotus purpuratus]|uniref:Uncharacterized protein n=1 Tax=Strongylocentrotus purpuratus TaxID=7668 RepID=A0A7M7N377_STRPU|nr:uncharacterized protein LOC581177 [Strongylocentrotus purpuratus]XP_030830547.1 uncharacterized protein LOC115918348 [Strongylocentrotus purpuratus]|eukprot:XP_003724285.2 PREDICTED: alkaline serine protease ver112 isoform X2 [Strongylocentrotus purpuratus]